MIRAFGDAATEDFFHGVRSKGAAKFKAAGIAAALAKRLDQLNAASAITDMAVPPGNQLHALDPPLDGYFAVWVNRQFRLVFKFDGGHAYEVRCCDYHPHGK